MLAVKGIYDGKRILFLEPVPFKGKVEVIVTFLAEESGKADEADPVKLFRGSARGLKIDERLMELRRKERERANN